MFLPWQHVPDRQTCIEQRWGGQLRQEDEGLIGTTTSFLYIFCTCKSLEKHHPLSQDAFFKCSVLDWASKIDLVSSQYPPRLRP